MAYKKVINLVGQRFGKLTVLEQTSNIGDRTAWLCACDCGKVCKIKGIKLKSGYTKSCGCWKKVTAAQNGREAMQRRRYLTLEEKAIRYVYYQYIRNARNKGRVFELNFEDIKTLVTQPCHYCDRLPDMPFTEDYFEGQVFYHGGIDRLDSSKGYILSNCLPCCTECNRMKMDTEYTEFIDHLLVCADHIRNTIRK